MLACVIGNFLLENPSVDARLLLGLCVYIVVCHMADLLLGMIEFTSAAVFHAVSIVCYYTLLALAGVGFGWFAPEPAQLVKVFVLFLVIYLCGCKYNRSRAGREAEEINRMLHVSALGMQVKQKAETQEET